SHRDGAATPEPAGDAPRRAQRQGEAPQRAALRACRPSARFAGNGVERLPQGLAFTRSARIRRRVPQGSDTAQARERDLGWDQGLIAPRRRVHHATDPSFHSDKEKFMRNTLVLLAALACSTALPAAAQKPDATGGTAVSSEPGKAAMV